MNMDGYVYIIYIYIWMNLDPRSRIFPTPPGDAHFPKEAKPIGRRNLFALETVKYRWGGMG